MEVLQYEFMQNALLAGLLAAIACGIVGVYVVVKKIIFISGGIAHASFGGIGLGYLAGFSGQAVIENTRAYERVHPWVVKYGGWAILVFSAVPNPFFDVAGIAAGITKMPLRRFLLACWIGETIKMALFAYAGFYSLDWLINKF